MKIIFAALIGVAFGFLKSDEIQVVVSNAITAIRK